MSDGLERVPFWLVLKAGNDPVEEGTNTTRSMHVLSRVNTSHMAMGKFHPVVTNNNAEKKFFVQLKA